MASRKFRLHLQRYLTDAYVPQELRMLVAATPSLLDLQPRWWRNASLQELTGDLVALALRHARIDEAFFDALTNERPARKGEIDVLRRTAQIEQAWQSIRIPASQADPVWELTAWLVDACNTAELAEIAALSPVRAPDYRMTESASARGPARELVAHWRATRAVEQGLFDFLLAERPYDHKRLRYIADVWKPVPRTARSDARRILGRDLRSLLRTLAANTVTGPTTNVAMESALPDMTAERVLELVQWLRYRDYIDVDEAPSELEYTVKTTAQFARTFADPRVNIETMSLTPWLPRATTRVFISYRTEARDLVSQVTEALEELGLESFVDHRDILPRAEWRDTLLQQIRDCDFFVALAVGNFWDSEWTPQEIGAAVALGKPMLVVSDGPQPKGFAAKHQALTLNDPKEVATRVADIVKLDTNA